MTNQSRCGIINIVNERDVITMLTIIWVVFAIIAMYFTIGMVGVMVWETVASIKGACCVPSWLDDVYEFITEKMFFFFK